MTRKSRPVLNKKDFVKRYNKGEFGNRSPTWNTFNDFKLVKHDPHQKVHLRNRVRSGKTFYDIEARSVEATLQHMVEEYGEDPHNIYFSYMAPTEKTLIQGELAIRHEGLELFCSYEPLTMRSALRSSGLTLKGLTAKMEIDRLLTHDDSKWLVSLAEKFEDHVVEFSAYSEPFGIIPGSKTCIWEVRKY